MRNARIILLFSLACLAQWSALAQGPTRFEGLVQDSVSGLPIAGVHVRVEVLRPGRVAPTVAMLVTDARGGFSLDAPEIGDLRLVLSHLAYAPLERVVLWADRMAQQPMRLVMVQKVYQIPEVTIRRPAPELVFQRPNLHVGDHRVTDEGIWVLAYERPQLWHRQENAGEQLFREARLVLLDTLFNEVASLRLPGEVRCLYLDHRQRVVVDGRDEAWVAQLRRGNIILGRIQRSTLQEAILPWTDSIAGHLLGSTRTRDWPAFDHVRYDPVSQEQLAICAVQDDFMMELFRSQYKYMSGRDKVIAMNMEKRSGVDREVVAGFMTGFQRDPYFKVPYAPLFVMRDTLCVFDHARIRIRRFTTEGEPIDEVPMQHVNERGWRSKLIQDPTDGRVFALFSKGMHTYLRSIDPASGRMGDRMPLTHPFPKEVQVHGGHAYYVYRPPGDLDRRALFREALR